MKHIRKLLHFVRPYWKLCVISLALLTALVFMDLSIPRLLQRIIDQGIEQSNPQVVIQTTLIMLSISLVSLLLAIGNNIFSVRVGESVARDIREALFLQIQAFSYGNMDRWNIGQLMVRLTSDATVFQRLVQVSLRIGTRAPLLMVGSLILMYNTSPQLAMRMLPLLAVTGVIIVLFVTRMGPMFMRVQRRLDRLNMVMQENIAGVRVVKAFVRADHENERFLDANQAYADHSIRVMQFMATMSPALSLCVNIGIVLVLWLGGLYTVQGNMTVGQLVAFINYLQTIMGPLLIMAMLANVIAAGTASSERISEVLDAQPEVLDLPAPLALPASAEPRLAFKNVSFHYNGDTDCAVLDGINLVAEPGKMVAILGATGAGKSSLVNLIPRFYDVTGGQVELDGIDIRQLRQQELVSLVGIAPQETVLFSGTVRDNIRYGRPTAGDEKVEAAAKAAQAHDFIMNLPQGYDTHIEERGVNLSGGQKQRIAIARALLVQPRLLILDDSTSAVDVETETRIQAALKEWMCDRTSFVVAQRISTVLNADKIVVLDEGQIVAMGTHPELMRSSPIYQEIYESQLGGGAVLAA